MTAEADRAALSAALGRVARGEEDALRDVYDRTSARLFGVCLRILKNQVEAEDVLQEVYLTVWRKAGSFDEARASPTAWLAALARNRAIDRLRAAGARRFDIALDRLGPAEPPPSACADIEPSQDLRRLERCLSQLEEHHAEVVRTAFFEGVAYEALARRLDAPLGAVKGWIRRSLMKLRVCLET
ncbi:MAG TPA: sigma-70 family RNA polymerase sigma factor [Caulobacteraceae bacterium]|nr:sigma-70 family RNA polymerase sigma factor [Caulobacteraceae bacterium]